MTSIKRAIIFLRRSNISSIILILVLIVFFVFLIVGSTMVNSASKEIEKVDTALCNSFSLSVLINRNDPTLWTDEIVEQNGTTAPVYHSPVLLTDNMAERILQVEGVIGYNGESMDLMHTDLKVKEGHFTNEYKRMLNEPGYMEDSGMSESDLVFIKDECQTLNLSINTSSENNELFRNGALEIIEGRHLTPDDHFKTLVSEDFAQRNNLKIGDSVPLDISEEYINAIYSMLDWINPVNTKLEIVGIYSINFQMEDSDYTAEEEMPENIIFINTLTAEKIEKLKGSIPNVRKNLTYNKLTFFVNDPDGVDSVIDRMKQIDDINWDYVNVIKDDMNYQSLKDSLDGIRNTGLLIAIGAGIGCFIVISLLIIMRTKRRNREIGILLSNGISKKEIVSQMLFEILIISVIAFIIAIILSGTLIQPLGNVVNDSFSKGDSTEYEAYYDDNMNIVAKQRSADVNLEYDFTAGIVPATICIPLFLVPVLISSKKLLKKKPYDLLSE